MMIGERFAVMHCQLAVASESETVETLEDIHQLAA